MHPQYLLFVVLLLLSACDSSSLPSPRGHGPELSPADRQLLDKVKREEEAKKDLQAHPDRYIQMVEWVRYDKGIINTYSKVTNAELRNTSEFDVSDIRGEFTYLTGDGSPMATVPISFEGELLAGETKKLPANSREISGGARSGKLTVKSVRLRK